MSPVWLLFLLTLAASSGCSRKYWREQANTETYGLIDQATTSPLYSAAGTRIEIDPQSRMYDPTNPDAPPMPPDDDEAQRFMVEVDGHKGWPYWKKDGELGDVELSDYQSHLPYDQSGNITCDLAEVIRLARLHSREYQQQLETLFISALDVTFERFVFDAQLFAPQTLDWAAVGPVRNGGVDRSTLGLNNSIQVRKAYTTGASLVVNAANTIVWQFSGNDTNVHAGLLSFAFTQPLLQFAGRPRILERLTRSERLLLYNVRQLYRYRQGFYLDLTVGSGGAAGLSRGGGLFGGSGLQGFTGLGAGGFGRVGGVGLGGGGGFAGGQGVGAAGVGGFLGFLQTIQEIRNQEARVAGLRDTWAQLEAAYDAGRLENRFQVDFARQAYYTAQSQLLNSRAGLETSLDIYKIELGLPPDLPLVIADPFLDRFKLINPGLTSLQTEVSRALDTERSGDGVDNALPNAPLDETQEPIGTAPGNKIASENTDTDLIGKPVMKLDELVEASRNALGQLRADQLQLEAVAGERRKALEKLLQRPEVLRGELDARALRVSEFDQTLDRLRDDQVRLEASLEQLWAAASELPPATDTAEESQKLRASYLTRFSGHLLEMSLLQARVRLQSVVTVPIDISPEAALPIALENRPDWMNAKASLVDTWRSIRFVANALRSNLSLNVSGDLGTDGNNPVRFRSTNGTLRAGVQFDPPLTRVFERNNYREALITYQQQRRELMAGRDRILQGLRSRLRQIRLDEVNLELRRLAVDVAITQVDVARLKLNQPPKPGADAAGVSPTVARDLVDALLNLQEAQNTFLSVWLDFERQRMLLDYDMGTMQLDDRGIWIDPGAISPDSLRTGFTAMISTGDGTLLRRPEFSTVPTMADATTWNNAAPDRAAPRSADSRGAESATGASQTGTSQLGRPSREVIWRPDSNTGTELAGPPAEEILEFPDGLPPELVLPDELLEPVQSSRRDSGR